VGVWEEAVFVRSENDSNADSADGLIKHLEIFVGAESEGGDSCITPAFVPCRLPAAFRYFGPLFG